MAAVLDELAVPDYEPGPVRAVELVEVWVGDGRAFCHGDELPIAGEGNESIVLGGDRAVIANSGGVGVVRDNINDIISGVPVSLDRVPHPDEVVEFVVVGEAIVEDAPELLARLGSLSSPPEPSSLGLVKGTPEDGDVRVGETLELDGNCVNVANEELVVGIRGVRERLGDVELGVLSVEAAPPEID